MRSHASPCVLLHWTGKEQGDAGFDGNHFLGKHVRGLSYQIDSIGYTEYSQQGGDMKFYSPDGNVRFAGNLFVHQILVNPLQDLRLPFSEPERRLKRLAIFD